MENSQRLAREVESLLYFAHSPEHGPGQRIYTEEDICIAGGLNVIEQQLQREVYWYGRLGEVNGRDTERGVMFDARAFSEIVIPIRLAL